MFTRCKKVRTISFSVLFFLSLNVNSNVDSGLGNVVSDSRQQQLAHLVKHDCGSCHGMTLQGGLGPALLAQSLKNKSNEVLFVSISEGRPSTPMPAWKSLLSADDIYFIIKLLRDDAVK